MKNVLVNFYLKLILNIIIITVGGVNTTSWYLLNRFLQLATDISGKPLRIANPYTRVYKKDSIIGTTY